MSACLVVMQPTFMPWAGYFNLMSQAEDFVFLDDVQLEKQSWQTRNRIIINGRPSWISLQIRHKNLAQSILESEVVNFDHWCKKLTRSFAYAYSKHPYFHDTLEILDLLGKSSACNLAALNEIIICFVASRLGLTTKIHLASKLRIDGVRSDRLVAFCDYFGAKEYLSPLGSANYLAEDGFSVKTSARLRFQNYQPSPYPQRGVQCYISQLSILDVLANLGWEKTARYVLKGAF